jgi:aspartate/methionine/tyrosine aminotransferase
MDILARCKQMEAQGRDVIHMEIGEPDFDTPIPILKAGEEALRNNLTHYTSAQGLKKLRQAISLYYQDRFNVSVDSKQIIITPGASGALQLVLTYLLQNNQTLMISDPTYPCNRNVTNLVGGKVLAVPVNHNSNYQLSLELIVKNWRDDITAVLIASPSNPTGTVCSKKELLEIAQFLKEKNSYLIVDEIYQGLTYGVESETVAGQQDNILVLNSFSKHFGMTGWRVGWTVVPVSMIEDLDAIAQNTYLATSTIAQHAALAAFSVETKIILEERRAEFGRRRDMLCQSLAALSIHVPVVPQGAFYVYANISDYSVDSFIFCKELLEDQALAITPGCDFGEYNAQQFVRFAYTTNEERILQGMQRLAKFLKR